MSTGMKMNKDEILELSKIESGKNCCTFCQSKCSQCGSVNIEVEYYRFYDLENDKMVFAGSLADVCCHDCGIKGEQGSYELEEGGGDFTYEIIKEKEFIRTPTLAEQIDNYFDDDQPLQLSTKLKEKVHSEEIERFVLVYKYENDTRNQIDIEKTECACLDKCEQQIFGKSANLLYSMFNTSILSLECKDNSDDAESHYVIESKKYSITAV